MKIFVFIFSILLLSCSTSKKQEERPSAHGENPIIDAQFYEPKIEKNKYDYKSLPQMNSVLNVNYKIHNKAIGDTFNLLIDELIFDEFELPKLEVVAQIEKLNNAQLEFSERDILITLPLKINLNKQGFLKDLKASGELELQFISHVDIDSDWNLKTETELNNYVWLQKPKLDLGLFEIPIENVSSMLVERTKLTLVQQIDQSIKDEFVLRQRILQILQFIETPLETDPRLGAWMQLSANKVEMTGLLNSEEWTSGIIKVDGNAALSSDKPTDKIPGINLPAFEWNNELNDTSQLKVFINLTYKQINATLKENFVGQTFREGDKEVFIKDIAVGNEGEDLLVHAQTEGSFNGTIVVKGKPEYDHKTSSLLVDDLDIKVKTKNILHKAAAWMMKGKIKSQLQDMATISIHDWLEELQSQIDNQIDHFNKDNELEIKTKVQTLDIDELILDGDRMHALVNVGFNLSIEVYDFKTKPTTHQIPKLKN